MKVVIRNFYESCLSDIGALLKCFAPISAGRVQKPILLCAIANNFFVLLCCMIVPVSWTTGL